MRARPRGHTAGQAAAGRGATPNPMRVPHHPNRDCRCGRFQHTERVRAANPVTYVSKDAPPFLIMHGLAMARSRMARACAC